MVTRRQLVLVFAAEALAAPMLSVAQQPAAKVPRIGYLSARSRSTPSNPDVFYDEFVKAMRELGYVDRQNILIEYRSAEGKYERLPELATDLVRANVDVFVTHGTPGALAAKQATATIPIVITALGDPVATGVVAGLARSGGNITGSAFFNSELMAKRLELLKDAIPRIRQVAVLMHRDNAMSGPNFEGMKTSSNSLKVGVKRFDASSTNDLESVVQAMAKERVDAMVVQEDGIFNTNAKMIADLAITHRLPSAGSKEFGQSGGLLGYGVDFLALYHHAAHFVDRLLRGAKVDDLPFEQATKFDLIVNKKTAKALSVELPQTILVRADRIIE